MKRDPLRAIVVGSGFGCRVHVPALRAAGFTVAGLVGTDPERLARRAQASGIERTFTDLAEAIAATGAGAVTIATPPSSHAALTLCAIGQGCHVLCEKPMAMDLAEANRLALAARQAGVVALMGHEFRWQGERALIGRAIAQGLIGAPRFLTLLQYLPLVADPQTRMPHWWFDAGAGGGWLGASGSHLIDQIISWLGPIDTLSAALPTVSNREGGAEDSYILRFRTHGGVEGVLQQTAGAWGPPASLSRVAGTLGTVWSEGGAVHIADKDGTRTLPLPEDLAPPTLAEGTRPSPELPFFIRLAEAFRSRIMGETHPLAVAVPDFEDGVACMRALDAIRRSAQAGGECVRLDD